MDFPAVIQLSPLVGVWRGQDAPGTAHFPQPGRQVKGAEGFV